MNRVLIIFLFFFRITNSIINLFYRLFGINGHYALLFFSLSITSLIVYRILKGNRSQIKKISLSSIVILLFFLVFGDWKYWKYSFLAKKFGLSCNYAGVCNNLMKISCRPGTDGPIYYVKKDSQEIIEYCGGYCMVLKEGYCQNCPPKEWTCD